MNQPHERAGTGGAERRWRSERVLVVADARRADPLVPPLAAPVTTVGSVYDAIGEVTIASGREPIALVLVESAVIPGPLHAAADALRLVDPSLRIVLISDGVADNGAPPAEGFDAALRLPQEAERLRRMVEGGEVGAEAEPARGATAEGSGGAAVAAPGTREEEAPSARPEEPDAECRVPGDERCIPLREQREPTGAPAGEHPANLGDVDLVGAVMDPSLDLRDRAIALIAQQTGWSDVALVERSSVAPAGAARAPVRHGRSDFGLLVSAAASAGQLEPWAAWLAHWLALDRSYAEYRLMAYQDDLTGAWNRRFFELFLTETISRAREQRRPITVMFFDIDDFKQYNDQHGHHAGDTVLIETVRLLKSVIRRGDRVCRMGGDEFAVIFGDPEGPREHGSTPPSTPEQIAVRFQDQISRMRFPKLGQEAPGRLSISAGLAIYPWDGVTAQQLAECADRRALQSKQGGKNAITLGPA